MAAENDISEYPIISITNGKEIDNNEAETLINNMINYKINISGRNGRMLA